jgi:hypothetical protein
MLNLLQSEGLKVALLAGAFVALYALSRWASRLNESSPGMAPPPEPIAPDLSQAPRPWSNVVRIDHRPQFHSSQAVDEADLRPVRILRMYFSQFDFEPGPPDPSSFADELFVKLYDENTGYDWIQSFYVASPRGLDEMLQRESWDYAYTDRVFFVRRYDAKTIRMAVIEQLLSTQEKPSPPKGNEDAYV